MEYPKITPEAARVNAHMTQRYAAKRLNIAVGTLRNYETGKTLPDVNMVMAMADLYHFPYDLISFSQSVSFKLDA